MPVIEVTSTELADLARGCRALARQAREDAQRMAGTSSETGFYATAAEHEALAARLERARATSNSRPRG